MVKAEEKIQALQSLTKKASPSRSPTDKNQQNKDAIALTLKQSRELNDSPPPEKNRNSSKNNSKIINNVVISPKNTNQKRNAAADRSGNSPPEPSSSLSPKNRQAS